MSPSLDHNDYVVITHWYTKLAIGDLVLAEHPKFGIIIKRVLKLESHGVWLVGDNTSVSTSTEKMGLLPFQDILGKVLWHVRPNKKYVS